MESILNSFCKIMTKEEKISAIVDVLFYNANTGQLTVEKCYELAEKIIKQVDLK